MKNSLKRTLVLLGSLILLTGCSTLEVYKPEKGGVNDTLHNEVHVATYGDLEKLKPGEEKGQDVGKTYITDDDGLKYAYRFDHMEGDVKVFTYVCITEYDTTINFYFDNTQTSKPNTLEGGVIDPTTTNVDCPIYTFRWYMMKPMGTCPLYNIPGYEGMELQDIVLELGKQRGFAPKYDFTNFLGFSFYSTCLGDYDHLWNFATDHKTQAVVSLYGVWVD